MKIKYWHIGITITIAHSQEVLNFVANLSCTICPMDMNYTSNCALI